MVLLNSLGVALVISLFGKSHVMLELSTCLNKILLKYIQGSLHIRFLIEKISIANLSKQN